MDAGETHLHAHAEGMDHSRVGRAGIRIQDPAIFARTSSPSASSSYAIILFFSSEVGVGAGGEGEGG